MTAAAFASALAGLAPAFARSADDLKAAEAAAGKSDFDQAFSLVTRALSAGDLAASDQDIAHRIRGNLDMRQAKFAEAIADYTESIRLKPDFAEAYFLRGLANQTKGDTLNALIDYDSAIRVEGDFAPAYNSRRYLLAQAARLDEALRDCTKALSFQPHAAPILHSRAFTYFKMGRYAEAIQDYSDAQRSAPNYAIARYGLGAAKLKTGDPACAGDIAAAVKLDAMIAARMARLGIAPP